MPRSYLNRTKVCAEPGCHNLIKGKTRCRYHEVRDRARTGHGNRAWRRTAEQKLQQQPWCENCERDGRGKVKATLVHHKDGRGPNGPRGLDPSNLASLCDDCQHTEHRMVA